MYNCLAEGGNYILYILHEEKIYSLLPHGNYTFYMKKNIFSPPAWQLYIIHSTLYIKTIITHGFIYKDKAHSPYSPVSY